MAQHKRRKLSHSSSSILTPLTTNCVDVQPPFSLNAINIPNGVVTKSATRITSALCHSCHRASIRPLLTCQRCASPTCTICSRTCHPPPTTTSTSYMIQLSGVNKVQVPQHIGATKTKRTRADAEGDSYPDIQEWEDDYNEGGRHGSREDMTCCARTICRGCCVEDARTDLVQCLDCRSATSKLAADAPDPELSPAPIDTVDIS